MRKRASHSEKYVEEIFATEGEAEINFDALSDHLKKDKSNNGHSSTHDHYDYEHHHTHAKEDLKPSSEYGVNRGDHTHHGVDYPVPVGTLIHAVSDGVVKFAGWQTKFSRPCNDFKKCGAGIYVKIDHGGGIETIYMHLSKTGVSQGQKVRQGQVIGLSGNTGHSSGPHIHFELRQGGSHKNPESWMRKIMLYGLSGVQDKRVLSSLNKRAFNIVVEPMESNVQDALQRLERIRGGNYFKNIEKIVIDNSMSSIGMVKNTEPGTVYINVNKIKSDITSQFGHDPDQEELTNAIVNQIAETVGHEKVHLDDLYEGDTLDFNRGEGPSEQEEHILHDALINLSHYQVRNEAIKLFEKLGDINLDKQADVIYASLTKKAIRYDDFDEEDLSDSLIRIIYHFAQKVSPESVDEYLYNMKKNLSELDVTSLSEKSKRPGAGIGSVMSLIKNLFSGLEYDLAMKTIASAIIKMSDL